MTSSPGAPPEPFSSQIEPSSSQIELALVVCCGLQAKSCGINYYVYAAGSRLLVSVGNSVHYLYDTLRPNIGPTAAFTGHATSSFFIKACFSPDGTHILSGSSDKNAYIWQAGLLSLA